MYRLALLATSLSLCACQLPASGPANTSDVYVCPNGSTLRVSHGEDNRLIRLGMHGRVHTLTRRTDNRYDNGHYLVQLDEKTLRLEIAGTLLPQHCLLQAAARPAPLG